MKRGRLIAAVMLLLVGLIWMGQGAGLIPGSFMTGDRTWLVIGAGCVAAAAVLGWPWVARRR